MKKPHFTYKQAKEVFLELKEEHQKTLILWHFGKRNAIRALQQRFNSLLERLERESL